MQVAGESKTTTDHEEIREWIEARGGSPAIVSETVNGDSGVLRVDFPGFSGEDSLERITWEDFFRIFEENELAFLYQEKTNKGEESRFFKFINRGSTG